MNEHDLLNGLSPEERAELGEIDAVAERLNTYTVPEPDSARLLAALKPGALKPIVEQRAAERVNRSLRLAGDSIPQQDERMGGQRKPLSAALRDWLRLARLQTKVVEASFWWACLLVIGIGALIAASTADALTTLLLILSSPLIAILGVAMLFRPATRTLWELEQFGTFQPFELLYVRLALILLVNLAGVSLLLFVAGTQGLQIVLWRLLLIWLGPMIGLTGIALFASLRWNSAVGLAAPLVVWAGTMVLGWRESILDLRPTPTFDAAQQLIALVSGSPLLLAASAALLVIGVVCIIESGRQASQWR